MPPRQAQIPGFERDEHPDVVEAAEAYIQVRDERARLSKQEALKAGELLAVMRVHEVRRYTFLDSEGLELEAYIHEPEPKAKVRKTGEADVDIGADDEDPDVDKHGNVTEFPSGLIAQAMRAQGEANVEEVDGDVIAPSTNGANGHKAKRNRRRRSRG